MVNIKYIMKDSDKMTKESKNHDAALKLINDIALIDTELAAKIKPSIDMFIESLDSTLSNNELFTQLADFFKLTDDNAKKQWLSQHQELANKINEIFDSMNKQATTLNEAKDDEDKKDLKKEDKKEEKKTDLENGETKKDVPITNDDLASDKKEDKKKNDEPKKEEKKEEEKAEDKESEKEEKPVEPKDLKLPEDGFKDDKVTAPAETPGDDKRFMGKTEKDLPKPDEMFPPTDPKVVDVTKDQVEDVKVPSLATINNSQITKESVKKVYESVFRNSMNKVLLEHKLIKEAVDTDKYSDFLDQCQLDWAMTNVENGNVRPGVSRFVPIRKYATQLFNEFENEFDSYEDALAVAKEWYAFKGKRTREAERIVPSRIYIEMRRGKDLNFTINVYLVKTTDLTERDADVASDLFTEFADEFIDDKPADQIWTKLPKPVKTDDGLANVYMISIPLPKNNKNSVVLSHVKHDVANLIRSDYKDYYLPTTKVPSWIYSQLPMESLDEARNVDYKKIYKKVIDQIFQQDVNFEDYDFMDRDDAIEYILDQIPERLEYYCDKADIDYVEAAEALSNKEIEKMVEDYVDSVIDEENENSIIVEEKDPYKHEEVPGLARDFVYDLIELESNPWDMTVYDFIDWAWDWGNVPQSEIPYIADCFNDARMRV